MPAIKGAEGLIAGYWAVDREHGKRMGVLIWKDAEAPGAVMPGVSAKIRAQREAAGRGHPARSRPHRRLRGGRRGLDRPRFGVVRESDSHCQLGNWTDHAR